MNISKSDISNLAKKGVKKWLNLAGHTLNWGAEKTYAWGKEATKFAIKKMWKHKKIVAAILAWALAAKSPDIYNAIKNDNLSQDFISFFAETDENISNDVPTMENYRAFFANKNISKKNLKEVFWYLENAYNTFWDDLDLNEDIIFDLTALFIKESHLNKNARSGNAIGYGQLKPIAEKDIKNNIAGTSHLDRTIPKDNVQLALAYFKRTKNLLDHYLEREQDFDKKFIFMAYNWGAKRVASIMNAYQKETGNDEILWTPFARWLVAKIETNPHKKVHFSSSYNINYNDWFAQNHSRNNTLYFQWVSVSHAKIQEMVNYVEKIQAIRSTDQSKFDPKKPVITPRKPTIQTIAYNEKLDTFHGDGWWDKLRYKWSSHDEYNMIKSIPWKGINAMLTAGNIKPNQYNRDLFREINGLDSDDPIYKWAHYLIQQVTDKNRWKTQEIIQNPSTSSVSNTSWNIWETVSSHNHRNFPQSQMLPKLYEWMDSIEVTGDALKWKTIILDPWHGGIDPWASPVATKDGKPIPYKNSDLAWSPGKWRKTLNGRWDQKLHVVEQCVVMDVSMRLAELIIQNGGRVRFTHFSQIGPENIRWTASSSDTAPGFLDNMQNFDTQWASGQKFTLGASVLDSRKRKAIRNKLTKGLRPSNTFALSIHADMNGKNRHPMTVLYSEENQKKFAQELQSGSTNAYGRTRIKQKGLYINRGYEGRFGQGKHGGFSNSALIELANMGNSSDSYLLRSHKNRQKYAQNLYHMIINAAQ